MDPYQRLANAIIEVAANDYRAVLRNYGDRESPQKRELECFFRSQWFRILTDADGEKLMLRLRQDRDRRSRRHYSRTIRPRAERRGCHGEPQ